MVKSTREAKNFTLAGFLYVNGDRITSLKHLVPVGDTVTIELRFPNGVVKTQDFYITCRMTSNRANQRQTGTFTIHRRA
jgi:ribosomal protein S4